MKEALKGEVIHFMYVKGMKLIDNTSVNGCITIEAVQQNWDDETDDFHTRWLYEEYEEVIKNTPGYEMVVGAGTSPNYSYVNYIKQIDEQDVIDVSCYLNSTKESKNLLVWRVNAYIRPIKSVDKDSLRRAFNSFFVEYFTNSFCLPSPGMSFKDIEEDCWKDDKGITRY